MDISEHVKEHLALGIPFLPNSYTRYVGSGGKYSTIAQAVANTTETSQITERVYSTHTETLTKTNGSAVITGSGTTWRTDLNLGDVPNIYARRVAAEDLMRFLGDTRYYKIKSVESDTQFTLYEPYQGTTVGPSSQVWNMYYLKRLAIVILPGQHTTDGTALALHPGIDLFGFGPDTTFVSENTVSPVFNSLSDNRIQGISFSPNGPDSLWGDMDGITNFVQSTLWAGAEFEMRQCKIVRSNLRGYHASGNLRLPILRGGKATFSDIDIWIDGPSSYTAGGAVTATIDNTKVLLDNVRIRRVLGHDISLINNGLSQYSIWANEVATYDLNNIYIDIQESSTNPLGGNIGPIYTNAACIINMNGVRSKVVNTSGTTEITTGVEVTAAATVNISNCDIDAQGTGAVGIFVNAAGAVVNVRTGTRIKGTTNSINCAAGTVNVSANADLIGATTGVGTINLATAT